MVFAQGMPWGHCGCGKNILLCLDGVLITEPSLELFCTNRKPGTVRDGMHNKQLRNGTVRILLNVLVGVTE